MLNKFIKKLYFKLYTFVFYFFNGLHAADKIAFSQTSVSSGDKSGGIEAEDEVKSVYKDLLRGEITQDVIELRHEMYYSERKSHDFDYIGNGLIRKKQNNLFNYDGKVEESDGYPIILVHFNDEIIDGLIDASEASEIGKKDKKTFSIKIKRDFIARHLIEEYTKKIVVKDIDKENVVIDFYISQYCQQFNKRHRFFINEMDRIYQGDKHSEIIDFKELSFTTENTYGSSDLFVYSFTKFEFFNIVKFDGDYVLKFYAKFKDAPEDLLTQIYSEEAQQKSDNHENREGKNIIDWEAATTKVEEEEYDVDSAINLVKSLKK